MLWDLLSENRDRDSSLEPFIYIDHSVYGAKNRLSDMGVPLIPHSPEPAILVMHHSMKPHPAITATLLDFMCRVSAIALSSPLAWLSS